MTKKAIPPEPCATRSRPASTRRSFIEPASSCRDFLSRPANSGTPAITSMGTAIGADPSGPRGAMATLGLLAAPGGRGARGLLAQRGLEIAHGDERGAGRLVADDLRP